MSKISQLDDYKMGKLKGRCTDTPEKERLNTSDENYRRGWKVGKKAGSKDTLDNAFSDSARDEMKNLIARYRKTKDSALFDRILAKYQSYTQAKGVSDSTRGELKKLIAQYRKTKDSELYNQITSKFNNVSAIKDDDDDNLVLLEGEDGDYVIAKKFVKEDLEGADTYLKDNPDKKVLGQDENGDVLVTDKDDDDDQNEENTINEKDLKK